MEGSNSQRSIPAWKRVKLRVLMVYHQYLALPVERPPEGEDQVDHLLPQSPEGKDDPVGHPVHILLSTHWSIRYLKVINW